MLGVWFAVAANAAENYAKYTHMWPTRPYSEQPGKHIWLPFVGVPKHYASAQNGRITVGRADTMEICEPSGAPLYSVN